MDKQITLIKNNDKKDWTDLEWIREFYEFMQGENPDSIKTRSLDISKSDAFLIIWYLQEHFPVLPDNIEKCDSCSELFDSNSEGYYSEDRGTHFCECSATEEYYIDNQ